MNGERIRLSLVVCLVASTLLACLAVCTRAPDVFAASPHNGDGTRTVSNASGEPEVCSGCVPPLSYSGGPVMSTNGAGGVTVTPIYWQPSGGKHDFPATFESIINQYIRDIAVASGKPTNVYSDDTEYYQTASGVKTYITYKLTAGTPVIDTDALPASGCTPSASNTACITDKQLVEELRHLTSAHGLKTDLAHFYPVFFGPKIETKDLDGTTSVDSFCGYHRSFGSGADQTVYANVPFEPSGCDAGQTPNGLLVADGSVSTLSHELNESITDPEGSHIAWNDETGHEIGDMCGDTYGPALGSTSKSNPDGTEYNQVINGDKYYTQTEFSDFAYKKYGLGKGCTQSEALAQNPTAGGTGSSANTVSSIFSNVSPTSIPANGKSTTPVRIVVEDPQGNGISGDPVHYIAAVQSGFGHCGTFSAANKNTDDSGIATVTYTASTDNLICSIIAVEAKGGRTAESLIYQGTDAKLSPAVHAAFPTSVRAGGATTTFSENVDNRSPKPLQASRVSFYIWQASPHSKNVNANQVHVSYSTAGSHGSFKALPLTGSTGDGNAIIGYIGPEQGSTLPAHSTEKITFHVDTNSSVPASSTSALFSFESYLEQVNSASGSGDTLADSYSTNVDVTPAPQSHMLLIVLLACGALILLVAVVLLAARSRRNGIPQSQRL